MLCWEVSSLGCVGTARRKENLQNKMGNGGTSRCFFPDWPCCRRLAPGVSPCICRPNGCRLSFFLPVSTPGDLEADVDVLMVRDSLWPFMTSSFFQNFFVVSLCEMYCLWKPLKELAEVFLRAWCGSHGPDALSWGDSCFLPSEVPAGVTVVFLL